MRVWITRKNGSAELSRTWCAVLAMLCALNVMPAAAEEPTTTDPSHLDCRYEGIGKEQSDSPGSSRVDIFPEADVFRPLMADPKQPQFFAAYQTMKARDTNQSINLGSVGFGENFGLVGRRNGCDGWQVGVLAGVFAQFDLGSSSIDLINADYVVGIPVSWRSGLFSTRLRLYHQSSHLGDEFLLTNPGVKRVDLSFEAVEAILSLDAPGGWGRVYAGGTYLVHREPAALERNGLQWGVELRGPDLVTPVLVAQLPGLRLTPVLGADFKSFEALSWNVNGNVVGGLEWAKVGSSRRFRLLLNYYHGFAPYGQFFAQKVEWFGVGLYLSF